MPKLKSLIIDPFSHAALTCLQDVMEVDYCPHISDKEILEIIDQYDVLILRSGHIMTASWLISTARLKAVIRAGNGTDNIPIEALQEKGILFYNIADASTNSVAEYAVGLMIALLRNFFQAYESVKNHEWLKERLLGNELRGKTVGLIGFGRIGVQIAHLLKPFEVNIIYTNKSGLKSSANLHTRHVEMDELTALSDIISIQVPLDNSTRYFIDQDFFSKLKRQPYLINISRMDIINLHHLRNALSESRVKGIAIDPFEKRHLSQLDFFEGLPVYFMPHLGANTYEAQKAIAEKISDFIGAL